MERKEAEKRQRELLYAFDKEWITYSSHGEEILKVFCIIILLILMMIPLKSPGDLTENYFFIYFASFSFAEAVLMSYSTITEIDNNRKKTVSVYRKLRYVPISRKQYVRVRLEYLFRVAWKVTLAGLILHCGMTFLCYHQIGIWNLIHVLFVLFVVPMIFGWLEIVFRR